VALNGRNSLERQKGRKRRPTDGITLRESGYKWRPTERIPLRDRTVTSGAQSGAHPERERLQVALKVIVTVERETGYKWHLTEGIPSRDRTVTRGAQQMELP
jgi:hypothetical protein